MAGAMPVLKIGEGFGTWLIPVILFGILGSVAVMSLIVLVCTYSCRSCRKTTNEPEATHEVYRTPTIPYRDPPSNGPVDSTIGRLITHSRSLHVPRNQMVNPHRLRPQVSSPELRNTSQPPPYTSRTTPIQASHRNPRPRGQIYFDEIINPGHPQRPPLPPENLPTRPERCFSASSPSSYSSSCMSIGGLVSAEAFSPPSTPSIFSQESLAPVQPSSWVGFPEPQVSDSDVRYALPTSSSQKDFAIASNYLDPYEIKELPAARPRNRSEILRRNGHSGQNNRRLIIVDNNLVSGEPEITSDGLEAHAIRQAEVTRLARSTLARTVARALADEDSTIETMEPQVAKLSRIGQKRDRDVVFKVVCHDTNDLWKMPVIPGETLNGFANRVKQRAGGDVILFMNNEILASEEDWKFARGGGRIVAHLIR